MPELPEVETIRRELSLLLPRAKITAVNVRLLKMVKMPLRLFRRAILDSQVRRVHRRAKLLLIELSSGWTIVIHLKMSGQLIWRSRRGRLMVGGHPIPRGIEDLPNKYSHVVWETNRGTLFFNDQRQFGYVKLIHTDQIESWLEEQSYGPEPLSDEFTFDLFNTIVQKHRAKRVKSALLDQSILAGIGNIYADESCHYARLCPSRRLSSLTVVQRRTLYRGIRHVMNLSIKHKGTTADAYRTANGQPGGMMPFLRVYGRAGRPCRRADGGVITKTTLVGRGTHLCPVCQH